MSKPVMLGFWPRAAAIANLVSNGRQTSAHHLTISIELFGEQLPRWLHNCCVNVVLPYNNGLFGGGQSSWGEADWRSLRCCRRKVPWYVSGRLWSRTDHPSSSTVGQPEQAFRPHPHILSKSEITRRSRQRFSSARTQNDDQHHSASITQRNELSLLETIALLVHSKQANPTIGGEEQRCFCAANHPVPHSYLQTQMQGRGPSTTPQNPTRPCPTTR